MNWASRIRGSACGHRQVGLCSCRDRRTKIHVMSYTMRVRGFRLCVLMYCAVRAPKSSLQNCTPRHIHLWGSFHSALTRAPLCSMIRRFWPSFHVPTAWVVLNVFARTSFVLPLCRLQFELNACGCRFVLCGITHAALLPLCNTSCVRPPKLSWPSNDTTPIPVGCTACAHCLP